VRLEAVGNYLTVFFNTSLSGITALSGKRFSGNATVFLSSPWLPAASASISTIQMSPRTTRRPVNADGVPTIYRIYNSLFDDCSEDEGADAGCGRNLQCNSFSDGEASCGPIANSMVKLLHTINDTEIDSIIVSQWHQTCGGSSHYNNRCSTDGVPLFCTRVKAIVNGEMGVKSICLIESELEKPTATFEKRKVRTAFKAKPTNFCFSGCSGNRVL
jgi:hypothetical protein